MKYTIGAKLFSGFFLVLMLTALVGGIGFMAKHQLVSQFNANNKLNQAVAGVLDSHLEQLHYQHESSPQNAVKFDKNLKATISKLKDCQSSILGDSEKNKKILENIIQKLSIYRSTFENYVKLNKQKRLANLKKEKATGKFAESLEDIIRSMLIYMEVNVDDVEAFGRYKTVKEAQDFFDEIRMLVPVYMNSPTKKMAKNIANRINGCKGMLKYAQTIVKSDRSKEALADAAKALNNYEKQFDVYNQISLKQAECLKEMQKAANLSTIYAYKTLDALNDEVRSTERWAGNLLIIISISAVAAGLVIALMLTKSFVSNIKKVCTAALHVADGDFTDKLPENRSDEFGDLAATINRIPVTLEKMTDQFNQLSEAGKNGNLRFRGNTEEFTGAYKKIISIVNETLGNIAKPVEATINQLEKVSNYDLGEELKEDCKGDYLRLVKAINNTRGRLLHAQEAFVAISNGDIKMLEEFRSIGSYSENDHFVPSFIKMMEALQDVINDAEFLAEAGLKGDLSVRADSGKHKGAYSNIVQGINNILDVIAKPIEEIRDVMFKLSEGELSERIKGDYKGDFSKLKISINDSLSSIDKIISQVSDSLQQVLKSSDLMTDASQALSQGATEQAASLEEISSAMNEIASKVKENAINIDKVNDDAKDSREMANAGHESIMNMVKAMEDIHASSKNIMQINKVIDDIAFQTNLLAINAAIEAAQAGVQGKGFAVVAAEVRNLAARSAKAAQETEEMLEKSVKMTQDGLSKAQSSAMAFENITKNIGRISGLSHEVSGASNEQADVIGQINVSLDQIDSVTQQNTANAEETAASAVVLSSQSNKLQKLLSKFYTSSREDDEIAKIDEEQDNVLLFAPSNHDEDFYEPWEEVKKEEAFISF